MEHTKTVINNIDLVTLLAKWQTRLGLSDWTITIEWRDSIDNVQCPARTRIFLHIQQAAIRIMNINDRQQSDPSDSDPELDIVHELVHIRLWAIDPIDADGTLNALREQSIEWIAKALISLDRK